MKNLFEIYLLQEAVTEDQWRIFYRAIRQYSGGFSKFEIIFACKDNLVRYFIRSDSDLSPLSTNIDGILLRPVAENELELPDSHQRLRFVNFVTGGSLLDLKEKYHVKKGMELQYVVVQVRAISDNKANVTTDLYFKGAATTWFHAKKKMLAFPDHLLQVNFTDNTKYMHRTVPRYLNMEKSMHMLNSANLGALFEVDTFPYFSHNYFLNITNYEFDKHSFIIGASGSGKSKFISLFVDRLYQTALRMNYRVIVIDPHASLEDDFIGMPESKIIRFEDESTELFASAGADVSAATELTATLFKSLLADQYSPRLDRLLRFTLYVLFTAQNMSLDTLKRFLTDLELRNQILEHVREFIPPNITKFFGGDFNELRTQFYNESIAPIVTLVDEMQLQPALVGNGDVPMATTINENFLTVFSLNKVKMGSKVVKTVAGLIIQQVFLLAQSRAFNQKVIMIVDEVSVVQTPALAAILAEARKYNLFVFLTQQYFGQIDEDLRAAIFANVSNYYVFRTSEEDARALEGNLKIELPKELIAQEFARGIKEVDLRVRMLTDLNPRECIARVMAKGQLNPCIKLRTMDVPLRTGPELANPANLQAYEQLAEAVQLPSKFVERASIEPADLTRASNPVTPSQEAVQMPVQRVTPPLQTAAPPGPIDSAIMANLAQTVAPPPMSMNLSEIMASQSSSRLKVNKGKETA